MSFGICQNRKNNFIDRREKKHQNFSIQLEYTYMTHRYAMLYLIHRTMRYTKVCNVSLMSL